MFIDIAFNIIDMNGRVYDPLTAQFLSPDPYVQAPDNWLNYNRYAYCYGNPLMYTDPTGEQGSNAGWILDDAGFPISIKSLLITSYSADWEMYEQGRYYFGSDGRFMFYAPLPEDYAFAYITPTFEVRPPMTYQPYEPLDNYENIVNGYDPAVGGYSYMGEVGESIGDFASEAQYFVPVWGSTAMATESLREGDFLNFGLYYGMAFFEAFTLGYGSGLTQGAKATALAGARAGARMLKPLGLGSTGRTVAANLTEQMAMQEIIGNPSSGKVLIQTMKDASGRWNGWSKMSNRTAHGIEIHYNALWENGIIKAIDDFKFIGGK